MNIAVLPSELLIETFTVVAYGEPLAPLHLRRVCKWWRDIVDAAPSVWQFLLLHDDVTVSQARALLWMKRSLPLPVDVYLHITDSDMLLVYLAPLFPCIDRWRRLTLHNAWELHFTEFCTSPSSLQAMSVDLRDSEPVDDIEAPPLANPESMFTTCPSKPDTYSINLRMSQLPDSCLLTPLRITHLNISETNFAPNQTHPFRVLSFLTMFPALQSFVFTGWPHDDDTCDALFPLVKLPELHTLHLRSTCSVRAILSHIYVPQLRVLYLYHLNVDFRLHQLGVGVNLPELGDSADEASDFSQSPWSDLAIGMGLRTLITRCNPPIRVLEMDFSDMRTKDFIFVFDRLQTLQEFVIVASDMSDTVIKLFKPYRRRLRDGRAGDWTIRLPRLTRLELFNCQQLSGQAIVDALGTRVTFTDQNLPGNTLSEISVVNCDGLTSDHGQTLSMVLGSRFKVS
ncbi:hypothetical protein APHAL10511_002604 [Amanita phalloides]|nr:hypothetical protein APHAL10511_002604 [Amanita phalloides]